MYEMKWEAMAAMGQALSSQLDANTKGLHGRHDIHDEELDTLIQEMRELKQNQDKGFAEGRRDVMRMAPAKFKDVDLEKRYLVQIAEPTVRT